MSTAGQLARWAITPINPVTVKMTPIGVKMNNLARCQKMYDIGRVMLSMILDIWLDNNIFWFRLRICNIQNSFTIRTLVFSWCRRGQLNLHCTMRACNGGHAVTSVTIHLVIDPTTTAVASASFCAKKAIMLDHYSAGLDAQCSQSKIGSTHQLGWFADSAL